MQIVIENDQVATNQILEIYPEEGQSLLELAHKIEMSPIELLETIYYVASQVYVTFTPRRKKAILRIVTNYINAQTVIA